MSKEYEFVIVRTSDGNVYEGQMHLFDCARIHDILNQEEPFIALKGVRKNSGEAIHWILINRDHIVSVEPPAGSESGEYRKPSFTDRIEK